MDDFEFSVDISEQDWKCFFSQCEECNVLSPSLAGLEDSGMSDLDDAGARFAMKFQKSNLNTDLLEEDEPADSPWECPPDELYPSKHFSGGLESVLSGSEEDIHLQSVNMFIEQMKSSSEGVKSAKQGQVGVVQNGTMQGKLGGAGRLNKSTGSALPKNVSKLNSISDIKISKPVSPIQNKYFVRTDESSSESSVSVFMRHPYLKTQLYIESSTENENDPLSKINMSKGFSSSKPNPVMNSKYTVDKSTQVSQSNTDTMPKAVIMEGSPCASVKRKRRKKRRLSVEPANNLFSCERLCDSEDELFTWRRAIDPCFCDWSGLKHQHIKNVITPPLRQYTFSNSLPAGLETTKIQPKAQHCQYQSVLIQDNFDSTSVTKIWPSTDCDLVKNIGGFAGMDELTQVKEIQKAKVASKDMFRNEVKSITDSIFPSTESNDQREALGQSDRGSSAKLVMREEAEIKKVLQCQIESEHHQQLETQTLIAYQCSHMVENMKPTCISSISTASDKTRCYASQSTDQESEETLTTFPLFVDSTVVIDDGEKKVCTSSNHEIIEVCEADAPQETSEGYLITSGNVAQISELQALSDKQSLSTSYSTLSSGCTPETKPLPKENVSQTSECFALSQNGPSLQNESVQVISMYKTKDLFLQNKIHNLTDEAAAPCWDQVEAAITKCESKDLTDPIISDHAVFTMSSFWKEMEKITINDILGLRKEKKNPSSFLPSLQKADNTDCFTLSDLGSCIQTEEKKLDQACKDVQSTIPGPVDCNLSSIQKDTSVSALNELVPMSLPQENIYNTKITLNDMYEPLVSPGIQRGLRRMPNNISVQNLHLLHSDPSGYKCIQPSIVESVEEDRCNHIDSLPEEPVPKDLKPSSMIENLTFCISDLYSFFFSEKQPNSSLESPIAIAVNHFTNGDSVPENYDHFFSEFDTDTLFYTEEVTSELVPIFSCSRSSKTKKECRDAYDYFLVSSPDNSSTESDEEDCEDSAPIRVVTRFTRKASSKDIVTDAYEHFYTDRDLKQDFFKTTFSFRNFNLPGSSAAKPASTSAEALRPLRQKSGLFQKSAPISVLRNQDFSVLCNFDKRIITKLQQPLIFESIQTAVANPNLDAPLLPLKQSDMCLICIAFASWVLKTANPQVGDAWKAVLLANVSALSAIWYLRKYVKVETSAGEKKPNLKTLSPS